MRAALAFWVALVVCFTAAALGAWQTSAGVHSWYPSLSKPSWTPPNWLFGPVWSALYTMMAIAAWRVWLRAGWHPSLYLFLLQLGLNTLWSALFFGQRRPDLALVNILALWLAIFATLLAFRRLDRPAAWLLVPYLAWVSFAALLNAAIWQRN
jgi:tryptophan-rich sensory protein